MDDATKQVAEKSPAGNLTRAGMGRPKGSLNRTTKAAKVLIEAVAEGLGGADRMLAWCQEDPANEKAFWTGIYPKLLPVQLQGDKNNPVEMNVTHGLSPALASVFDAVSGRSKAGGPPVFSPD